MGDGGWRRSSGGDLRAERVRVRRMEVDGSGGSGWMEFGWRLMEAGGSGWTGLLPAGAAFLRQPRPDHQAERRQL